MENKNLKIDDLQASISGKKILKGVSLNIKKGESCDPPSFQLTFVWMSETKSSFGHIEAYECRY